MKSRNEISRLVAHLRIPFAETLSELGLNGEQLSDLERVHLPLAMRLAVDAARREGPLVVGINGAQGSGKTTLCALLRIVLEEGFDLRTVTFSIDDLYQTRAEREELAGTVHPLFITRGVPGTHDIPLGHRLLDALALPGSVRIPVFDKATDDRRPPGGWKEVAAPVDIVLFEGWCVGAAPQPEEELTEPVNELEAREDAEGIWRRHANVRLAEEYASLFARLDRLIMLRIPAFEWVFRWRSLQERSLAARTEIPAGKNRIMDETALRRFIMHYERLTRHMLDEMPSRADLVLEIDEHHRIAAIDRR